MFLTTKKLIFFLSVFSSLLFLFLFMRSNLKKKLNRKNSSVSNIYYHIIWIPKYRKNIIVNDVEVKLKQLLFLKASFLNITIKAIECMPDHIHLFVVADPTVAVSVIVKNLKGFTSFHLRKTFLSLNKFKALWAPSYYCETIGHINEKTIIKYINNQKNIS